MPDSAEIFAALDAAFIERMKALSEESTLKAKEMSDKTDAMMAQIAERYQALIRNPIVIKPAEERDGSQHSADSPKTA